MLLIMWGMSLLVHTSAPQLGRELQRDDAHLCPEVARTSTDLTLGVGKGVESRLGQRPAAPSPSWSAEENMLAPAPCCQPVFVGSSGLCALLIRKVMHKASLCGFAGSAEWEIRAASSSCWCENTAFTTCQSESEGMLGISVLWTNLHEN